MQLKDCKACAAQVCMCERVLEVNTAVGLPHLTPLFTLLSVSKVVALKSDSLSSLAYCQNEKLRTKLKMSREI